MRAERRLSHCNGLHKTRIQPLHPQQLSANDMVAAVDRRDTKFFALQILDVLDDLRPYHQKINALLKQNEDCLHRQSLYDAAKGAHERRREGHVAVQHRHRAEPRIHLNELDLQSFVFKKAFALGDVVGRVRIAPTR